MFNKLFAAGFHLQDKLQNATNERNLVKHNPRCLYDNRCLKQGQKMLCENKADKGTKKCRCALVNACGACALLSKQ